LKKIRQNIFNITAIFFTVVTLWSIYSFFSWHLRPLPEKLPVGIENYISENLKTGEPLFLSSELLDRLVLEYPALNIFPAGGNSLKNASSYNDFYIISAFNKLKCKNISKDLEALTVLREEGFKLIKCTKKDSGKKVVYASSFLSRFTVTTGEEDTPAEFLKGQFITGDRSWQKINSGSSVFEGVLKFAISAHPLNENKIISVKIPPLDIDAVSIKGGFGIADTGVTRRSTPVFIKFYQDGKEKGFKSVDGKWMEEELKGFNSKEPINVTIKTQNAARRHFFFDIKYVAKD
jgi:hypothetical protein